MVSHKVIFLLAGLHLGLACHAARAQEEGETPGAIPDPSSYKGSMQLQQEEQRQYQPQPQQDGTQGQYANPSGAGGTGGAGRARPQVDWWSRPPLPPEKNPLLGRWRQVASKEAPAQRSSDPLGVLVSGATDFVGHIANGVAAGGCKSIFGTGVIAFEPNSLQWVAPDGHEEILNHVSYRASGTDVVVITKDPGAVPQLIFRFPDRDEAVVPGLNCTMQRAGSAGAAARTDRADRSSAQASTPAAAVSMTSSPGAAGASLTLHAGATSAGQFEPFAGLQIWVTPEDPQSALGQASGPSSASVAGRLAADCHDPLICQRDWKAMSARALGSVLTDAAGNARTPAIPPGRYYLIGHTGYQTGWLFWHEVVEVHPGSNTVTLDAGNADLMR